MSTEFGKSLLAALKEGAKYADKNHPDGYRNVKIVGNGGAGGSSDQTQVIQITGKDEPTDAEEWNVVGSFLDADATSDPSSKDSSWFQPWVDAGAKVQLDFSTKNPAAPKDLKAHFTDPAKNLLFEADNNEWIRVTADGKTEL